MEVKKNFLSFLINKVTTSVTKWVMRREDVLVTTEVPSSTGFKPPFLFVHHLLSRDLSGFPQT